MLQIMKARLVIILRVVVLAVGFALCGVGLWILLSPAQYQATASIRCFWEDDFRDSYLKSHTNSIGEYDFCFPSYELKALQSDEVLGKAIEALNQGQTITSLTRHSRNQE
jgi:uncharacterized protein involved in exopolysaccharide biosynthesis